MSKDYEEQSDAHLVQRYQNGDEEAGNTLCQRYLSVLQRFFKRKIRNPEDAEDLTQETFLAALDSLKKGQSPRVFRSWLYGIATHVIARWIQEKQKQDAQVVLDITAEDESGHISLIELLLAPVMDQPEHETIDNEIGDIRRRFEKTLRPEELAVFQLRLNSLRLNSSMTFKAIGKELGIKPNTAKVRYHRAVIAFRAWLKRHYPDIYHPLIGGGEESNK